MSQDAFGRREGAEETRPDPVEEAGETTAAELIPSPADTRPIGEGTTADVEDK